MSRRYVKKATFNSLNQISPEVVAVVTAKDNLQSVNDEQQFFKRNYIDAVRKIIPKFYFSDERAISGTHVAYPDQLINSHILANKHQQTILQVSALEWDTYLSSIDTPSGFSKYFHKRNSPAQISTDDFQRNILFPLGKKFSQFSTSSSFIDYISGTFLPSIPLIAEDHKAGENLATLTASAFANDSSGTYKYLANNLGWIYFLNRTGPSEVVGKPAPYDSSVGLATLLTNTLWKGRSVTLEDTLSLYQEYLWRNQPIWGITDKIIPADYVSSLDSSVGTWTSGTQNIDRLKTLVSIVYSPHFLDSTDNKVENSFDTYFSTSSLDRDGILITDEQEAGPLTRFLEAISFGFADGVTEQSELNVLYDIGKCPEEFLELLAELIGWKFIGADYDKWRVQLRNAVEIYKMKGTRRSIQYLLDTLFSTGIFNVTTSDTLSELWESYVPDLIYYSLATSSVAFKDFNTYSPELALQFGIANYDPLSMETNIKYVVDKILFDLVREFPDAFFLGGKPFPSPQLLLDNTPYTGPYNIDPNSIINSSNPFPTFLTGDVSSAESRPLQLKYDPNFTFFYRDRLALIPPYEKRQYYTQTQLSNNLLERIEYYLICYGVDKPFAKQVVQYIKDNSTMSLDPFRALNSFLIFTKQKTYAPNYSVIIRDATKERTPDPVSLLSMWNGKSSHFHMAFDSSTFDWATQQLTATSKYGITKVMRVLDEVIPAHSIPYVLLTVSSVADGLDALSDLDCREWRPNFDDLYEGSSTAYTGFGVCAVDMDALATANGIPQNRFSRSQVDNINDVLLSGTTYVSLPRNTLRRRNFRNLLPETKMFTRVGHNNPGSLELSTPYYSSALGFLPLGFMFSSLKFKEVALRQNEMGQGIGQLIDRTNLHPVWDICQNLRSPSSIFGVDVSNTFASRAKQNVATSNCNTYGRRGQLPEILYTMNKIHDKEKFLQASSMVSGYYKDIKEGRTPTNVSSILLTPMEFSSWYAEGSKNNLPINVVRSIANYLINQESADQSLNYYEHFTFGRKVHELYNAYVSTYKKHGLNNNYDLIGGPNILSHTYGPLIYNSTLETDGSALEASGYLAASSPTYEVDISFYGGSGVLSISGMDKKTGGHNLGTSAASDSGDLPLGSGFTNADTPACEFRNKNLVSAIELVDTSSPFAFTSHPIFSIFNLSRDSQSQYSYAKYLINNQVIKYHRSSNEDLLPRIRVNINPSDNKDLSRNFLQPNHKYEVTVKAHNLDISSADLGGLTLGFWLHTEPEDDKIWSYLPKGIYDDCGFYVDTWEPLKVSQLSGTGGIYTAQNKAQTRLFKNGNLNNVVGSGEGNFSSLGPIEVNTYDYRCWEPLFVETVIPGSDPQAIANISNKTRDTIKFKFSTNNSNIHSSPEYRALFGEVHRLDQKYVLEFFVMAGDDRKFVVFEDIEVKDLTNYNKAVISTKYGEAQLDVQDLKSVFRFFKTISTGLASRNATITSGTMEVSGGSRLNYRSNISMYHYDIHSGTPPGATAAHDGYDQLSGVFINEG